MLKRIILSLLTASVLVVAPAITAKSNSASNKKIKTITLSELSKERPTNFYSMMESKDPVCQEILDELNKPSPRAISWLGTEQSIIFNPVYVKGIDNPQLYHTKLDANHDGVLENYYLVPRALGGVDEEYLYETNDDLPDLVSLQEYNKFSFKLPRNITAGTLRGEMSGAGSIVSIMNIKSVFYALSTTSYNVKPGKDHYVTVAIIKPDVHLVCKLKENYRVY